MSDRAWFSRLVRHPARKRSGSILTTPEPTDRAWSSLLVWHPARKRSGLSYNPGARTGRQRVITAQYLRLWFVICGRRKPFCFDCEEVGRLAGKRLKTRFLRVPLHLETPRHATPRHQYSPPLQLYIVIHCSWSAGCTVHSAVVTKHSRTVNVWNFLTSSVNFSTLDAFMRPVDFSSSMKCNANAFKRSIVSVDFSSFMKCNKGSFY